MTKIKNIVFDIGNVILHFDLDEVLPHFASNDEEKNFLVNKEIYTNIGEWFEILFYRKENVYADNRTIKK